MEGDNSSDKFFHLRSGKGGGVIKESRRKLMLDILEGNEYC